MQFKDIQILLIIFGWILLILYFSILGKYHFPKIKELNRKIIHIGTGPIIPIAWWLQISTSIAITISISITICLALNYQLKILKEVENVNRKTYGTIAYGLSISILFSLFWPTNPAAMSLGVLVMSFGDGFAGLIGSQFKSKKWKILGQEKSIFGTLAMGIVTGVVIIIIALATHTSITIVQLMLMIAIAIGLEQIGPYGIDNITVPIGMSYAWLWISQLHL